MSSFASSMTLRAHLTMTHQSTRAPIFRASVVRHDGQIVHRTLQQGVNQVLRNARQPKTCNKHFFEYAVQCREKLLRLSTKHIVTFSLICTLKSTITLTAHEHSRSTGYIFNRFERRWIDLVLSILRVTTNRLERVFKVD